MRKIIYPICFTFILLITGCVYQEAGDWQRCKFDVSSIEYVGVREDQTEWNVVLTVQNPGAHELKMEGVQATALIGADTLATLGNTAPIDLAANGDTKVAFIAFSTTQGFNKAMAGIKENGKCSVTIVGDAVYRGAFGTKKYPNLFHKTYDLDLETAVNAMGSHLFQGLQGIPF